MVMRASVPPSERRRWVTRVGVATAIALVAGLGYATAFAGAAKPAINLSGTGSYQLVDGAVTVKGIATGRPVTGPYRGRLAADDGSLPDPGTCEPATATLRVEGARKRFVELTALGDVCGEWTDGTYRVTHVFTGRYDLTDSFPRRIRGIDGFYEVRIGDDGTSSVLAIDT